MRRAELLLLFGALACAGGNATTRADAPESAATATSAARSDSGSAQALRPLHLARLEERAATGFLHDPHLRLDCTRCHAQVAGHERHANVACRRCHEAPAPQTAGASAPDCQSCHHASSQAVGCRHCHERGAAPAATTVRLELRLAGGKAARMVSFPHARHDELACTRCHQPGPAARAAAACTECHAQHHVATAECAACHQAPRAGVHQAAVHRGCGGSGCHTDATVLALAQSRAACLACHPAQQAHEPVGDCASCHNLLPAGPAGSGSP